MFGAVFGLFFVAIAVWFVWHTVVSYRAADPTETKWNRVFAATKSSGTLFWSTVISLMTGVFNGVLNLSDFFGLPEFRTVVEAHISVGGASIVMFIAMGIVTWARIRSGSNDPV